MCPDATSFITLLTNNATHERENTQILLEGLVGNNRRAEVEQMMARHLLGFNVVHEQINFNNYKGRPTRFVSNQLEILQLSLTEYFYIPMKVRKNDIRTVDSLILPFAVSENTSMTFWDVESTKLTYYPNR